MGVHPPGLGLSPQHRRNWQHFDPNPICFFQLKSGKVSDLEANPDGELTWLQRKSDFHTAPSELGRKRRVWHSSVSYKTPTKGWFGVVLSPLGTEHGRTRLSSPLTSQCAGD